MAAVQRVRWPGPLPRSRPPAREPRPRPVHALRSPPSRPADFRLICIFYPAIAWQWTAKKFPFVVPFACGSSLIYKNLILGPRQCRCPWFSQFLKKMSPYNGPQADLFLLEGLSVVFFNESNARRIEAALCAIWPASRAALFSNFRKIFDPSLTIPANVVI
jgi:hypothetical protein